MGIVNEKMAALGTVRSVIRDLYEYGLERAKMAGEDKVFDFSLGNPSVPAPEEVEEVIRALTREDPVAVHGYTSAVGLEPVRHIIAEDLKRRFRALISEKDVYMTCGAASALTITMNALFTPGDEFLAVAPYFPEYKVFTEACGALFRTVRPDMQHFQIDLCAFRAAINRNTKLVILNSPNNPTGAVLKRETLRAAADILREKEQEYGHPIFLIADEPYRELVYEDIEVPFLPNLYDDTVVCYSFSKTLSLPGERIGYIAVPRNCSCHDEILAAVAGAGRALGYVCAPALMQRVVAYCIGKTSDLSVYKKNRDLLYSALTSYGYEAVYPDGAFYLFVKSPEPDARAFSERAKEYGLLIVPSDSFGCPGYVRIAYCVPTDRIERSLPAFRSLIGEYKTDAPI